MLLLLRRVFAVLVFMTGTAVCAMVFLVGAPISAGAPTDFQEPVEVVCYDPWVKAHPGDMEPDVEGWWSWWPPGITCVHASGQVYVEPSPSDAFAVAAFGLVVLVLGMGTTVLVPLALWRSSRDSSLDLPG